jgi:hypothetical protein
VKLLTSLVFVVLFAVSFTFVTPHAKVEDGPSVSGTFQFAAESGPTRNIEFVARLGADGTTTGEATFRDTVPAQSGGSATEPNPADRAFSLKAELDCLVIQGNKAVVSGTVSASSLERYVGSRLLLVAQDGNNEANPSGKDRLTWGIYRTIQKDWLPKDSERTDEPETATAWIAKDAERPEDEGAFTDNTDHIVGCRTFPFSSFSFVDPKHGHGIIQVHP